MTLQFTWDRRKAAANDAKHGVTFDEAVSVFRDRLALIFDDDKHPADEYRELIIGHSHSQRILIVSFTERDDAIRIISARKATRREQTDYERHGQR